MNSLQIYSPQNLELSQNEISIYKGDLTDKILVESVVKVKKAFPSLPVDFYDIFTDRIRDNGFNDSRLKDAVNFVIDNCIYPTPTIAQFIGFDKRIKLHSYTDYLKLVHQYGGEINNSYKPVKFPDREKLVWVHVDDMKIAKLSEYKF
jgi:hypothetical protein